MTRRKVPMAEIVTFHNGKAPPKDEGTEHPVYGSNGTIGRSAKYNHEAAIILGRVGAYCGSVEVCGDKFWASDNTIVVKPKEGFDLTFLYYRLKSISLNALAGGAAQPLLTQGVLKPFNIMVPDHSTQVAIASIFSVYDDLIENNQRRIALLEDAARQLYKEWFVRFRFPGHEHVSIVGGVPEGWEVKRISDVVEFLGGFAFKSKSYIDAGKFGIVTIKNVHDGRFVPECTAFLDEVPSQVKPHCFLKTGDILMSLTGNIGRVCLVTGEDYLLNQRVAKVVPATGHREFAYFNFRSDEMQSASKTCPTGRHSRT